ncbi:MAG: DotI/IcmL/TraM family protein [Gammaproteobacteria bacterium]|nr:DotI/IcmL/TraM family protein [Gammaproteobacteria bacterium]MCW5582567.1 DotI/IcmL/TraM family protein [Gammaproteobacteria bacterium]
MALDDIQEQYMPRNNDFYREHYHHIIIGIMGLIVLMMIVVGIVFYQILNRPLPQFNAAQTDGKRTLLIPYDEPNLLPDTILRWASKAATVAYTFDFVRYNAQIAAARPYFTENGWQDYLRSVNKLITTIVQNQLFINGVVSGVPVISNQGPLPGKGYVWRIQIPFLVTYQSANLTTKRSFFVVLSIVRVPTSVNKQGIGIDQFVMV